MADSPTATANAKSSDDRLLALWAACVAPGKAGIIDGDGWEWDAQRRTYVSDTGTALGQDDIRHLALDFCGNVEIRVERRTAELLAGNRTPIEVDEWRRETEDDIDDEYLLLALLAVGGVYNLTDESLAAVIGQPSVEGKQTGLGIIDANERLRKFADEIIIGMAASDAQIINRAGSYAQSGWPVFTDAQHADVAAKAKISGAEMQYRNILDPDAQHCDDAGWTDGCPSVTAAGWQKMGTLTKIGARTCGPKCRCWWEYRPAPKAGGP